MASGARDEEFTAFVNDSRAGLLGSAYLMFSDWRRAEGVVQASLAHLYGAWPGPSDARPVVLHHLLYTQPGRMVLPWQRGEHFELVDSSVDRPLLPPGIVADLAGLTDDQRRVIILERDVELPSVQIARLMGTDVASVHALSLEAEERLCQLDPARRGRVLQDQLRAALPATSPAGVPAGDLARGRLLVRRRSLRTGLLAVAALLAIMVGVSQLGPLWAARHQASSPTPTAGTPATTCDVSQASCRTERLRDWRVEMAQVAISYVQLEPGYFSGYTYSPGDRYESPGFWTGEGGVLGLDLFRLNVGATEIYLQIATSKSFAIPCGQVTRQRCTDVRFMDGNVFTMADSTLLSKGLEVQYSPRGGEVITVVARNTSSGASLGVSRAQLMSFVQDDRLRLPAL